jgi:hypothetical protein
VFIKKTLNLMYIHLREAKEGVGRIVIDLPAGGSVRGWRRWQLTHIDISVFKISIYGDKFLVRWIKMACDII